MAHKLTTCTFCGVGCGLYLETSGNRVVGVYPSMSHPTNAGRLCVRGWHVHEVVSAPDRLRSPLIQRDGRFVEVSWAEALSYTASRLLEIRDRYGPNSLAFLNSPRCSNEESYLLQKLARAVIGTNNVDHGAGVYTNNSIDVLLEMIGVPAATNSISELDACDAILVDGVDLARQLPTVGGRVIRAKLAGAKLVVIDPRLHRVSESADILLRLRPGTEALLYGAMAKVIVDRGLMDHTFIRENCADYEAYLESLRAFDLLAAADRCGLAPEEIEAAALAYGTARSAAILYSTGAESRDPASIRAIVNLTLLTGHLGRPGSGIYPLTEQNNLQGVCDMGMLPDRLPGYRPVSSVSARAELGGLWGAELPSEPGVTTHSILTEKGPGRVKALWLCRYDPVTTASIADSENAIDACDFVVVQHLFMTDTAKHADVILPTTSFGEERVSFTSTDRRIQLAEKVVEPIPGPIPAWEQLTLLARELGADWRYQTSAEVMDEIGLAVPFYSGADYANLSREYGRQWPCTNDRPLGTRFLCSRAARGRRFSFALIHDPVPPSPTSDEYPFTLVFGHSLYYWNQNVLIQHSETLKREYRILLLDYPEGFVDVNAEDARKIGVRDGDPIRISSATGSAVTAARVGIAMRPGCVYVPYFVREVQRQIHGAEGNGVSLVPVRLEKVAP